MDDERAKRLSSLRASLGTFSDYSQNNDCDDIEDPILAYFNKRCSSASKFSFTKYETDRESSIGLIDVDNVSLFGDDEIGLENLLFLNNKEQLRDSVNVQQNKNKAKTLKPVVPAPEFELDKQRTLAQEALKKLNKSSGNKNEDSEVLSDISSKLMSVNLLDEVERGKNWLRPNLSPKTPRYFKDELSSFGGESENLPDDKDNKGFVEDECNKKRESIYNKTINSLLKDHITASSNLEFKTQTKEEQINRLKEDEEKFKLENAGILPNSGISQFFAVLGEDVSQWPIDTSNPKVEIEGKNLSIGQFFNLRSNRVSSLIGSSTEKDLLPNLGEQLTTSTLKPTETQQISRSESSSSLISRFLSEKPKFRRCVSTQDLNRTSAKNVRYSSESCSSSSTVMIQDILAEMESGLSGTQIYDKLLKSYKQREKEGDGRKKYEKVKKVSENSETPKSSKVRKAREFQTNEKDQKSYKEPLNRNARSSVLSTGEEFKENKPVDNASFSESVSSTKKEKTPKLRSAKGFCASTPKTQTLKSQNDKFKTECGNILMTSENWEAPRVKLVQSMVELNKSEISDENDKTITANVSQSSEFNKKTKTVNKTPSIEDTITAGDLTVLSQRIEEMKQDSVCIVRTTEPEGPILLRVIQKLAGLPSGTVDCSALTPLLRDEFPELLSSFPTSSNETFVRSVATTAKKIQDVFLTLPGSWVELPDALGLKEKLYACTDLQKAILVPVVNISRHWLLVSIESIELVQSQSQKLAGVKKNNEWFVSNLGVVSLKETIIPPNNRQSLKVVFKSKVTSKVELILTLDIKELMKGEIQTRRVRIFVDNVNPENYINVIPKDSINFGLIADECFDHRTVQITFDGICEFPLMVYIDEGDSVTGNFILKPYNGQPQFGKYENTFHHVFHEGEKQFLEFRVFFVPNVLLSDDSATQNFKAELVLIVGSNPETDGVLRRIPIKGSVAHAKFLWDISCTPLVFMATKNGQSVRRSFPLKNVSSLPIAFSVSIQIDEDKTEEEDGVFLAPKSFYLSKNETASIDITFKAPADQKSVKGCMVLRIKPNGRAVYETELIGTVASPEGNSVPRTSSASASTKASGSSETVPIKLLTTTHSLSWAAVPLEKEARQTVQIKSASSVTISVRITLQKNTTSFKLVNENGEKVLKLRKLLKPDCPCVLTVIFRPDVVGSHHGSIVFESNQSSRKKMILLNGVGGSPDIYLGNIKSDLNGCKILRLQHSSTSNQFENSITVKNKGRVPGFLLINSGMKDFSLSHELTITPSSIVVFPDSTVTIKISQKLKNEDLQQLLSDREICKVATISVLIGDEPSRMRIKQLVEGKKIQASDRLKVFTAPFDNELNMYLRKYKDALSFETEFLKSIRVHEVAVVIERNAEVCEPSILEDTVDEFVTFISTNEVTVISAPKSQTKMESELCGDQSYCGAPLDHSLGFFPLETLKTSHKRVTKWLETLDCA